MNFTYFDVIKQIPTGILLISTKYKILAINSTAQGILDVEENDVINRSIFKVNPFEEEKEKVETILSKIESEKLISLTLKFSSKKGKEFFLRCKFNLIDFDSKKTIQITLLIVNSSLNKNEELKDSEENFRFIAEQSFMGIGIVQNNRLKYVNEKLVEILGYKKERMLNWTLDKLMELLYYEDREFVLKQLERRQKNNDGVVNSHEYRVFKEDGSLIWLQLFSKIIYYQDNDAFLFMIVDISEKKIAEKKLEESEGRYKRLFDNMTSAVVLTTIDGRVLDVNPMAEKLSGYKREEMLGKKYASLGIFLPENVQQFKERFLKMSKGENPHPIEIHTWNKNGEELWLEYDSSIIKLNDEFYIEAIIQNITERKKAEIKLKKSEQNYKNMIENLKEGYFEVDLHGSFTFFNEAFSKLLNYKPRELMGLNYKSIVDNDSADQIFKAFNQVFKTEVEKKNYQFEMIAKSGYKIYGETTIHLKYDSEGNKIGFRGFMRDITEKKRAEHIIKEENRKLKQLDEMRKEFVNRASHELKTPLTSIHGALQLIEKMPNNDMNDEIKTILDIARKGSNRLKKLIFNLLDISRIEAKKFQLEKDIVNITDLINNCIKDMKHLFEERGQNVEILVPKKALIKIDPTRIEQVIINLLSNAIKNTPPKGKIQILLKLYEEYIVLYVKDSGIGLTKNELEIIFKKFSKIERYGKGYNISSEGTGLGLYISREIVESHGGEIWAESLGRNKGSTFYVKLPIND